MKTFRQKVEETRTFKQLNSVQKQFTLNKSNLKHLEDGFTIAKNIGYDVWKNQSGFSERNSNIVADILKNEPPNSAESELPVRNVQVFAQVQSVELANLKSYQEWIEFVACRATDSLFLALNPSGHYVTGIHLLDGDNYPITVYETVLPSVRSIPYQSLSHN